MAEKIEFVKFDIDSLPEGLADMVRTIQDLEKEVAGMKAAFTKEFTKVAKEDGGDLLPPDGMEYRFGFRFGGLAVGFAPTKSSATAVGFKGKAKPARTRSKSLKDAIKRD